MEQSESFDRPHLRNFGHLRPILWHHHLPSQSSISWFEWSEGWPQLWGLRGRNYFVRCALYGGSVWTCFWPATQFFRRLNWRSRAICFQQRAISQGSLHPLSGPIASYWWKDPKLSATSLGIAFHSWQWKWSALCRRAKGSKRTQA